MVNIQIELTYVEWKVQLYKMGQTQQELFLLNQTKKL